MIYLKDKESGKKYRLNLTFFNIASVELLSVLSYIVYGLIVTSILVAFNLPENLVLSLLFIFYAVNIIIDLCTKYRSFTSMIFGIMAGHIIKKMIVDETPQIKPNKPDEYAKEIELFLSNQQWLLKQFKQRSHMHL